MTKRKRQTILAKILTNLAPPTRTLLRLVAMLMACIIFTAIILSFSFSSFMRQSLINKSVSDIDLVHSSYENMTDTAKSILLTFYYDSRAQQLINSEYVDYTQIHKALLNVSSYYQHHPYVSTYYFINRDTNYVFCNDGAYELEDFYDQEILELLSENDVNIKFEPIYRNIAIKSAFKQENVFTYVYFDVYDNVIDPKIIVINLSEDYFLEQINNTIEDGSRIDLLDKNGNCIFSTASGAYNTDSHAQTLADFLSDNPSDYSIKTIDGEKTIVSYRAYSDITIVKYVPYSYVTEFSVGFIRLSFLMAAVLLALVFIIVILSSMKLIKSFSAMHSRYTRVQGGSQTRQKQTVLKEILLNASPVTLKELRSEYNAFFGTDQDSTFCVALFRIDQLKDFNDAFTSTHRNSFLYSIVNVIEELFTPIARACGVILDNCTVAVVFSHLTEDFNEARAEEIISDGQKMFRQQFQYSFSAAVSEVTTDINQAYQSASTLIPYRFLLGHQSVIFYSKVAANESIDWRYPSEIEQDLSRYISTQQWEKAAGKIAQFSTAVKAASYEDARSAIHRLLFSIQITMDSLRMSGISYPSDIQNMYPEFYEAEVLDEICTSLHNMLHRISNDNRSSESALQQNERLVNDVKLYIVEHYPEFNLSLNTIAQSFHTSPNVLGRIFKALAGKPVFQYITQVRLKRAEELLLQSKLTNKEIALACGFENTSYFYSLFKEELGLTPSEYRKRHKMQ